MHGRRHDAAEQLNLLVIYRHFSGLPVGTGVRHPDFESSFAEMQITPALVEPTLDFDVDGKLVMVGRCVPAGVTMQCPNDQQLSDATDFDQTTLVSSPKCEVSRPVECH